MTSPSPPAVLDHYPPPIPGLRWVPLGAGGGFSGAAVWRGESDAGEPLFALKAWPAGWDANRLVEVHRAMARARDRAGLPFVPNVVPAGSGETAVEVAGQVWDVTTWMPGVADFATNPSDARLAAAMATLAALHRAWVPSTPRVAVCPGVVRRLAVAGRVFASGLPNHGPDETACRSAILLSPFAARAADALRPWATRAIPLQLCLRDIWHDHVLFTGDRVTGVIDYGAVAVDHPAVDLARLLDDLVGTDYGRIRRGVELYRADGGIPGTDPDFVLALADGGLVGSVLHWLDRVAAGEGLRPAAAARFRRLVARLAARAGGGC